MYLTAFHRFSRRAAVSTLALALSLWVFPASSAQSGAQFNVTVQLAGGGTSTMALCRSNNRIGAFGKTITVICSTGEPVDFRGNTTALAWAPMQDGAYRYVTLVSEAGAPLGMVDSYAGAGTFTFWRLVKLSNLDYLELLVGW